jgi:putative endonuclease
MSLRGATEGSDEAISTLIQTYLLFSDITQKKVFTGMSNKQYCVYILTNSRHTVLYTGVTNNLERRLSEHKSNQGNTFTKRYNVDQLVYYECGDDISTAIAREKQIKAGSRQDKINLINSINSEWKDLSKEFWK